MKCIACGTGENILFSASDADEYGVGALTASICESCANIYSIVAQNISDCDNIGRGQYGQPDTQPRETDTLYIGV
jgi:hypothetical protein